MFLFPMIYPVLCRDNLRCLVESDSLEALFHCKWGEVKTSTRGIKPRSWGEVACVAGGFKGLGVYGVGNYEERSEKDVYIPPAPYYIIYVSHCARYNFPRHKTRNTLKPPATQANTWYTPPRLLAISQETRNRKGWHTNTENVHEERSW